MPKVLFYLLNIKCTPLSTVKGANLRVTKGFFRSWYIFDRLEKVKFSTMGILNFYESNDLYKHMKRFREQCYLCVTSDFKESFYIFDIIRRYGHTVQKKE